MLHGPSQLQEPDNDKREMIRIYRGCSNRIDSAPYGTGDEFNMISVLCVISAQSGQEKGQLNEW